MQQSLAAVIQGILLRDNLRRQSPESIMGCRTRVAVLVGIFGQLVPSVVLAGPSFRPESRSYGATTQPQDTQKCAWGSWSAWGGCSVSCGQGQSTRMRVQVPTYANAVCTGSERQNKPCQMPACNTNPCAWRDWSAWGACSTTCGAGIAVRTRSSYARSYGAKCTASDKQAKPCTIQACPKACTWNAWSAWGPCSATCGAAGVKTRTRTQNPATNGGAPCVGSGREVANCGLPACPLAPVVSCQWSAWASVGTCSKTCGGGVISQTRTRSGTPRNGGTACVGEDSRTVPCNTPACPVDCTWSAWANVGSCSKTCGTGSITQTRTKTPAQNGGRPCSGDATRPIPCNTQGCPDPIGCQGTWGDWSVCPAACGATASQSRTFTVTTPALAGGEPCPTSPDTRQCQGPPCPVDCTWSAWTNVGSCSKTCGTGSLTQTRTQTPAQNGGQSCTGDNTQSLPCNTQACPIECTWSAWDNVGSCSKTCGTGSLTQTRTQTPAQNGGQPCTGDDTQSLPCNTQGCADPISCQGAWGDWSACPAACGATASQSRTFTVSIPAQAGGDPCPTSPDTRQCQGPPCPVDCTWSAWDNVGSCSKTCGTGSLTQTRTQTPAQNGGQPCTGDDTQSVPCNTQGCPVDCTWSDWDNVGSCSKTCGTGSLTQTRTQTPAQNGGQTCTGDDTQSLPCNTQACPDPISCQGTWGDWSACPAACGATARQSRTFTVTTPAQNGGDPCPTSPDTRQCQGTPCPVDCTWSDWANVGSCSKTCGTGSLTQTRTQTPAQNGGQSCSGDATRPIPCNTQGCPVDCTWSAWANVGSCSKTCGVGSITQTRTQTPAQNGGQSCSGSPTQSLPCNTQPCPVDCTWSAWANVGSCSTTCGSGTLTQSRTQTPAQNGGQSCTGNPTQSIPCNTQPCPCTYSAWSTWSACPVTTSGSCGQRTRTRTSSPTPCTGTEQLQQTTDCTCVCTSWLYTGNPSILYFVTSKSVPRSQANAACQVYGGQLAQVTLAEISPPGGSVKLFQEARSDRMIANRCNDYTWLAYETGKTCIRWNNMNPNTCSGELPVFCEIINPA